jgi:hypothetical protein
MNPVVEAAAPTVITSRGSRDRTLLVGLALAALTGIASIDAEAAREGGSAWWTLFVLLLPIVPLAIGLFRAPTARAPWLLGGVPAMVALGALLRPRVAPEPIVFIVLAGTLLGYVVLAARLCTAPSSSASRTLARPADAIAPRVRRRLRMYRVFTWCAALAFAVPLGVAILALPGGPPQPLVLVAVAGLLGTIACRAFLIDALDRHLQRDPQLVAHVHRLRRHARHGRPAPLFYAAALVALAGMTLFASRHLLGLGSHGP